MSTLIKRVEFDVAGMYGPVYAGTTATKPTSGTTFTEHIS